MLILKLVSLSKAVEQHISARRVGTLLSSPPHRLPRCTYSTSRRSLRRQSQAGRTVLSVWKVENRSRTAVNLIAVCTAADQTTRQSSAANKTTSNFPAHLSPPLTTENNSGNFTGRQADRPTPHTGDGDANGRSAASGGVAIQAPAISSRQASESGSERQAVGEERPATGSKTTIRDMLVSRGIILRQYAPGQHNSLTCPKCKGGGSAEKSFSLLISDDSETASWNCHRGTCGWAGGCSVHSGPPSTTTGNLAEAVRTARWMTVKGC